MRIAAASPRVSVADPQANVARILEMLQECEKKQVGLTVFPELCLSGYTCGDLFGQSTLLQGSIAALEVVKRFCQKNYSGVVVVGLPLAVGNNLFNVAAVLHQGEILGLIPKSYLPTYKEFYEHRWFSPAAKAAQPSIQILGQETPFGTDLLFCAENVPGCILGVEICEDLWMPVPPSSRQALEGATVLVNLSASTELVGKAPYRRMLVSSQSGRCLAAYLYAGSGVLESTTDVVFGGHNLIAENGTLLAESARFDRQGCLTVADIDLDRLVGERLRQGTFGDGAYYGEMGENDPRRITFRMNLQSWRKELGLERHVDPHPFVPAASAQRDERCQEIFHIQTAGLAKRLETVGVTPLSIGVSGGLDSTLALLVACKTLDRLGWPRGQLQGLVMPGFGSTTKTKAQAESLIGQLGVQLRVADIRELCLEEMRLLGHKPFGIDLTEMSVDTLTARLCEVPIEKMHDLVFENVQARMRTSLLMNAGFVIGTGDLSELALGWCTYNADHISMYNPNVSVPKTLVRFLVRWAADHEFSGSTRALLHDIAGNIITPELLPTGPDGQEVQSTEASIGPYELQDFFLYHFLRFGVGPEKLLFLAGQARFDQEYPKEARQRWLGVLLKRFFANQFKRSCLPDGPKVGTVSLSPRSDWRMPSDAAATAWRKELGESS